MNNGVSKLLSTDGYIQVNKVLIRELGLHEAIILGELCSEYNYWEKCDKLENDMFYSTRDNIEYNTGLNEHYQRKAISTLKERGILEIKKQGIPAVNYYRINFDKLLKLLSTSSSRDEELDVNLVNLNNNKQTKITKENNSKELLQDFRFGKTKSKKDNLYTKCVSLVDYYTSDAELHKALIDYLRVRLEMRDKPLYANSWKGLLNKLDREFDASERLAVVRQSTERGYASFFPVSNYSKSIRSESGAINVPSMTAKDYEDEAEHLAELESQGVRVRF
jgi:hypothetical protein